MDGRLLLARLGPGTSRWDAVRGGKSEFSQQDVAAALGMIKDDLSRELFCHVWLPHSTAGNAREIEQMLLHLVLSQCKLRVMQAAVTQLSYSIAELESSTTRRHSTSSTGTLLRYRESMNHAKERRWPSPSSVYRGLARCVLAELGKPAICARCRGTGQVRVRGTHALCPKCHGKGDTPRSDLARARALHMTWHAYTKAWKNPYEWTLDYCNTAIQSASDALCRNLGYPN